MHLPDFKVARTSNKLEYKKIRYNIEDKYKNKYIGKTCYLRTYGCQMNVRIKALRGACGAQRPRPRASSQSRLPPSRRGRLRTDPRRRCSCWTGTRCWG